MVNNVNSFQRLTDREQVSPRRLALWIPSHARVMQQKSIGIGLVISVRAWLRQIRNLPQLSGVAQRKKAVTLDVPKGYHHDASRRLHDTLAPVF